MENIISIAQKRYAAKHYDPAKKLTAAQIGAIKDLLRLSPSSVNSQPWHFIIAETAAAKQRLTKATEADYPYNSPKIMDSGLTVIFCARTELTDDYLQHLTDKEREDGRFDGSAEIEAAQHKGRLFYADLHRQEREDAPVWTAKQVYLNIGFFLLGVAAMGLDATPLEGFDPEILNREFNLPARGLDGLCMVAVGHRAAADSNATRPKSRLAAAEIIEEI